MINISNTVIIINKNVHKHFISTYNCRCCWLPSDTSIFVTWAGIHIDGLVQDCSNSIANTLEILQSCMKPLICIYMSIWGNFDWNTKCFSYLHSNTDFTHSHNLILLENSFKPKNWEHPLVWRTALFTIHAGFHSRHSETYRSSDIGW